MLRKFPWEWIFWLSIIAAIFVLFPYFTLRATANCNAINANRIEGRTRGLILREFLIDAAEAREKSAQDERGALRQVDLKAATRYRALARKIRLLPIRGC